MERTEVNTVRWIVKAALWIAIVIDLVRETEVTQTAVALVLVGLAAEVAHARFVRLMPVAVAKCALFVLYAAFDESFALLAASAAFDMTLDAVPALAAIPVVATMAVTPPQEWQAVALCSVLAASAGWMAYHYTTSWHGRTLALDRERRSRRHHEEMQKRLERTSRELIRATERAERTRIAQTIHDDVGHRLTGVLMQIQAARRLATSQPDRSMRMLDTATGALTAAVESMRETVYDLRPREESDAAAIRRICAEFRFCPVDVSLDDGVYSALAAPYRDVCLLTIRELLTNAARHSRAKMVRLRIDIGTHVSLVYEDDGVGTTSAREGIGIEGIRSRTETLGGTVVVSGHRGFVVRVAIPLDKTDTGGGAE